MASHVTPLVVLDQTAGTIADAPGGQVPSRLVGRLYFAVSPTGSNASIRPSVRPS